MRCKCGREYHPAQSWIHEPDCRYLAGVDGRPELKVNHVPPENRGYYLECETFGETETETRVSDETAWERLGISKATYYRRKQEQAAHG